MTSSFDQEKQDLLQQVIGILSEQCSSTKAKQARYYAEAFFRRVPMEELSHENPSALAAIVSEQMDFISKRPANEALVSVFNPTLEDDGWESQHTVVEMVNDDMPFLVDSANVVMSEMNIGVHLMIHPVIHVERDDQGQVKGYYSSSENKGAAESIIHMQIDRHNDPDILARIQSKLKSAMHDVRLAVSDWKQMLDKANESVAQLPQWAAVADPGVVKECQDFLSWMKNNHFVFLGCRDYEVVRKDGQNVLHLVQGSGLGLLRETPKSILSRPLSTLSDEARTNRDNPLIIIDDNNGIHSRMDDACQLLLNRPQPVPGFLMHRLDGSQFC